MNSVKENILSKKTIEEHPLGKLNIPPKNLLAGVVRVFFLIKFCENLSFLDHQALWSRGRFATGAVAIGNP